MVALTIFLEKKQRKENSNKEYLTTFHFGSTFAQMIKKVLEYRRTQCLPFKDLKLNKSYAVIM